MEKITANIDSSFEHRTELASKVLRNMKEQHGHSTTTGIMLAGDPGVGKTSFMHYFAKLVGIELIVIEAPHITEEHIVNIPFIVVNPLTGSEQHASTSLEDKDNDGEYSIVLSKSHLLSLMENAKKISDSAYLSSIYKSSSDFITVFENLGGDKNTIPDIIAKVRNKCSCILFLDEYFRQSSVRIQQILRGILDKKIGIDDLPESTYVIFASNLSDTGGSVSAIPQNQQFRKVEFGTPNKDDWFSYLIAKFEKDKNVKLDMKIIEKFHHILNEEDLNFKDLDSAIRTSPRRWEQLILYINSSLPAKDQKDALGLLTNVKVNFKDYLTGDMSSLAEKVIKATIELIEETSDITLHEDDANSDDDWKDTLEHQIKQKMKLGKHRKYIPIVSGLPGIGKTSHAYQIAKDLDLGLIYIKCSNLSAEDVIGIPLAKGKGKKLAVDFSEPVLYKIINKKAKAYSDKKGEYKYLIMFDELNETSTKVYNSLRRVILEGKFSDGLELPKGSVVISAINPTGLGKTELTDHMKDVVDILDATTTWKNVKGYMHDMKIDIDGSEQIYTTAQEIIDAFNLQFRVKSSNTHKASQLPFFLNVGEDVYVSPREYTDLYSNLVSSLDHKIIQLKKKWDQYEDEPDKVNEILRKTAYHAFEETIGMVLEKHEHIPDEFLKPLKDWFLGSDKLNMINDLLTTKSNKTVSFAELAGHYFNHPNENIAKDSEFVNYMQNTDAAVFKEDFIEFLNNELKTEKDVLDHVIGKNVTKTTKDAAGKEIKHELSKFSNLLHGVAEACKTHNMSFDKLEMIKETSIDVLSEKMDDDNIDNMTIMLNLNAELLKLIKELTK